MDISKTLNIGRIELSNFRGLAECKVNLDPKLTVFVAENGRGKTAILDGIAAAIGYVVDGIAATRQATGFYSDDVRLIRKDGGEMLPVLPTSFSVDGHVFGQDVRWTRLLSKYGSRPRTSTKESKSVRRLAEDIRGKVIGNQSVESRDDLILPLVAYYGTGRLWGDSRLTKWRSDSASRQNDRLAGYVDCLSSQSSFKLTRAWYESKWREAGDPRFKTEGKNTLPLISAIRAATSTVLEPTEWSGLNWNATYNTLEIEHPQFGVLPMSSLSDGVRTMLALVVDVARRCATLNPQLGEDAAQRTPGVLLIDEVDMHLHPRWQQRVTDLLRRAFPSLQIILSTHSPHVLSTVDKSSIRVIRLEDGIAHVETPEFQTRGVESADVLSTIMGVDPIPKVEEASWLREYRGLIEDSLATSERALSLRAMLEKHFGSNHPVILDADRLIRFQEFRLKKKTSENS
ncbi:MAG: AAA family ATPase [Bacteriovoracia bacterium]